MDQGTRLYSCTRKRVSLLVRISVSTLKDPIRQQQQETCPRQPWTAFLVLAVLVLNSEVPSWPPSFDGRPAMRDDTQQAQHVTITASVKTEDCEGQVSMHVQTCMHAQTHIDSSWQPWTATK